MGIHCSPRVQLLEFHFLMKSENQHQRRNDDHLYCAPKYLSIGVTLMFFYFHSKIFLKRPFTWSLGGVNPNADKFTPLLSPSKINGKLLSFKFWLK